MVTGSQNRKEYTETIPQGSLREKSVVLYLAHTQSGHSIRALARASGLHPSTVLRRVRKVEDFRDDPLFDSYLENFDKGKVDLRLIRKVRPIMSDNLVTKDPVSPNKEDIRLLRRLAEKGAFLVISENLERGAIMRSIKGAEPTKTAVIAQKKAQEFVVKDWIRLSKGRKVNIYKITEVGQSYLRRVIAGIEDAQNGFANQHREFGHREMMDDEADRPKKVRVNLRESPLTMLGRKKDKKGKAFLSKDLLDAGERFREDFELAQMGPRIAQNWDRFLDGGSHGQLADPGENGSSAAQKRFREAFEALGEGLGDIAVRCCCFLEGLEAAEKRMGWSARSGKIVLRIALTRLRVHYDALGMRGGDLIG